MRPPWLAATILRLALPRGLVRETVWGDMLEEFRALVDARGMRSARRCYNRQVAELVFRYCIGSALADWRPRRRVASPGRSVLRSRRGDTIVTSFVQDIRYAIRGFVRAPVFAAIAVLTIAIGIGANTAIFSVVNAVILQPLPYPDADRIVRPWAEKRFSREMFDEFREVTRAFEGLSAFRGGGRYTLAADDHDPELLTGAVVSVGYFDVLGARPWLGRTFLPEAERLGGEPSVILSYRLWQRSFGGDEAIVGRVIQLDGDGQSSRTVVGVMPEGFVDLEEWELWTPLIVDPADELYVAPYSFGTLARLAPSVSMEQARADVRRLVTTFKDKYPVQFRPARLSPRGVITLHESIVGDVQANLWLLLAAVGVVLLIACSNVSNLLLARSGARKREIALRLSLGADRRRLIRQLLTESGMLGMLGGVVGVVVCAAIVSGLISDLPEWLPRTGAIRVDLSVVTVAAFASVVSGVLLGLIPAVRFTGAAAVGALRDGGRGGTPPGRRHRVNDALVGTEIALAVVLVVSAGLLLKSFSQLQRVDLGFDATNLLTLRPYPSLGRYPPGDERNRYFDQVMERIGGLPGVERVASISLLPMTAANSGVPYVVRGQPVDPSEVSQVANFRVASQDYFELMGIRLLEGRLATTADDADTPPVGVINETMARLHWPNASPIGAQLVVFGDPWVEIVGVVSDIQQHRLDLAPRPQVYQSPGQGGVLASALGGEPFVLVRASGDATPLIPSIRRTIWDIDDDVPILQVRTMNEVISASLGDSRFYTTLFSSFAVLALLLGAVGVYGVLSYIMSQRSKEIGVRMALGATSATVLHFALRRGMAPVAIGGFVGLGAAYAVTRFLERMLFEVPAADPGIFAGVNILILLVGMIASVVPAQRAARVDPVIVLSEQ